MPDNFRRGSSGDGQDEDAGESWPGCGAHDLPPTGRDKSVMFWESIGMKPGDDWQVTADKQRGRGGSDAPAAGPAEADKQRGRGGDGSEGSGGS